MTTKVSPGKGVFRGIPTLIAVDQRSPTALYRQIYDAYRTRIVGGELLAGQTVPSTREMARQLRISRLPVLNAYAQLLAEGFFETRTGTGTFVACSFPTSPTSGASSVSGPGDRQGRSISSLAASLPPYEGPFWAAHTGPFQIGQTALEEFPLRLWSKLVSRCSRSLTQSALRYATPMGHGELRELIASYVRTSRGVRCEAGQIMIVSGSQQALDIATRVLLDTGARVWVEEPGYWLVHHVLKAAGCRAVPVPVDTNGLDVAEGIKRCRNGRAAFVTPSHQFPLGVTMSATRRLQLLEWAHSVGAWIVEDDYDSEFRYDSMPIASLQGLDTNARVIYIGTFSKVLFPSLRVGYLVIPTDLVERFAALRQSMDVCPPYESQIALAELIRGGHFSRHIRRMRTIYGDRRRVLAEEIQRECGELCTIVGSEAGMRLTILLRGSRKDQEIAAKAQRQKLWVKPLSQAYVGKDPRQGLVLGFGSTRVDQIAGGVRLLKKCLSG
jgi:GntR family transcriptional regulator/MocR family aminotransferase